MRLLRRFHGENLHLIVFLLLAWSVLMELLSARRLLPEELLFFAAGACLFQYHILYWLGYFDAPPARVPMRGICAGPIAALIGGLAQIATMQGLARLGYCQPLNLDLGVFGMCALPLGAAAVFVDSIVERLLFLGGFRYAVLLCVSDDERRLLLRVAREKRLLDHVQLLEPDALGAWLKGADMPRPDAILVTKRGAGNFDSKGLLLRAHLLGIPVRDMYKFLGIYTGRIRLPETDQWTFLHDAVPQTFFFRLYCGVKSLLEPAAAALLCVLTLPVSAVIAVLIKTSSPGPIFIRQRRVGYLEREFTLYKFRSMRCDAERDGPQWARDNDSRVTRIGSILRRLRLDELPQLWNIARGDMSFIGPRPERPEICGELVKVIPLFPLRTIVRPGITGWAQVEAGYASSVEDSAIKLEHDLYYIQNMSPRFDLQIAFKTLKVAFTGDKKKSVPVMKELPPEMAPT